MARDTMQRTLRYYATCLRDSKNEPCSPQNDLWTTLLGMNFGQRTVAEKGSDRKMAVRVFADKRGHFYGRFHRSKKTDFPTIGHDWEEDTENTLKLPADRNLRDSSHFVWWDLSACSSLLGKPMEPVGILVAEHNQAAPRASSLPKYVTDVFGDKWNLDVTPLTDPDPASLLQRAGNEARTISFRDHSPDRAKLAQSSLSALTFAAGIPELREYEVALTPVRGDRFHLVPVVLKKLFGIADEPGKSIRLKLNDGNIIDLEASLVRKRVTVTRLTEDGKSVDSVAMWRAIEDEVAKERAYLGHHLGRHWSDR